MKAQFKYAFINQWHWRSMMIFLSLVFYAGLVLYCMIRGASLDFDKELLIGTSFFLAFVLIWCIIIDFGTIHAMIAGPRSYVEFLAPVAGWKRLLAKVMSLTAADGICAGLNIMAFLLILRRFEEEAAAEANFKLVTSGFLNYLCILLPVMLVAALHRSYFSGIRAGRFLTLLTMAAIISVLNLMDLLLIPFSADVYRSGLQISIVMNTAGAAGVAFPILKLCKVILLFGVTAYVMERKINI